MARKKSRRDDRYEKLYAELLTQTELLHQSNKRRIRRGLWGLLVMPLVMAVLLWLTDSSRIVFLLIWVLGMFVLSAYLITVEYLDFKVLRAMEGVSHKELDFDELLELDHPIHNRIVERREAAQAQMPDTPPKEAQVP